MLEYTYEVGEAGDRYVRSLTLRDKCPLPATFRWEELFRIMQQAALEAGIADGRYRVTVTGKIEVDPQPST